MASGEASPGGSVRSTGPPFSSTTVAWSTRNCSALPRAMSERTASSAPRCSRSRRTFGGFSPSRSASRSISASSSSSVASMPSWATTARSARSAWTAFAAPSRTPATNVSWSWPVAARYCGIVHALGLEPVVQVVQPALHLLAHERLGRVDVDELGGRFEHLVAQRSICACTLREELERGGARRRAARRSVSNSLTSDAHSSSARAAPCASLP